MRIAVADVLEHVEADHHVEGCVSERKLDAGHALQRQAAVPALRLVDEFLPQLDTASVEASTAERVEESSCPAANLEDLRTGRQESGRLQEPQVRFNISKLTWSSRRP